MSKSWAQRAGASATTPSAVQVAPAALPASSSAPHHPADDASLPVSKSAAVAPTDIARTKETKDKPQQQQLHTAKPATAALKSSAIPATSHSTTSSSTSPPRSSPSSSSSLATSNSSAVAASSAVGSGLAASGVSPSSARNLVNYFLTNLRGHLVFVQLLDSTVYEGVFHTADIQPAAAGDSSGDVVTIIMKQVQQQTAAFSSVHAASPRLQQAAETGVRNTTPFLERKHIQLSDIVQMKAADINFLDTSLGASSPGAADPKRSRKGFATDSEISGREFAERELTRWEGGEDGGGGLEDGGSNGGVERGWDQFSVHERMTGKQSGFNFDDYSTPLDRDSAHYRDNLAHAARIAREIEGQSSGGNVHLAMERGHIAEADIDEDSAFSTVLDDARPAKAEHGKSGYVIPQLRRKDGKELVRLLADGAKPKGKVMTAAEGKEQHEQDGGTEVQNGADGADKQSGPTESAGSCGDEKAELKQPEKGEPTAPAGSGRNEDSAEEAASSALSVQLSSALSTATSSSNSSDIASSSSSSSSTTSAVSGSAPSVSSSSSSLSPSSSSSFSSDSSSSSSSSSSSAVAATTDKPRVKSKLNPNAKVFSLSASAKEFVPAATAGTALPATSSAPSMNQLQPIPGNAHPSMQLHPHHGLGPGLPSGLVSPSFAPSYQPFSPQSQQQQQPGFMGQMLVPQQQQQQGPPPASLPFPSNPAMLANAQLPPQHRLMNQQQMMPGVGLPSPGQQQQFFPPPPHPGAGYAPMQQVGGPGMMGGGGGGFNGMQYGPGFVPQGGPMGQMPPGGGGGGRALSLQQQQAAQQAYNQHMMLAAAVAAQQQLHQQQQQQQPDPRFYQRWQ